MAINLNTNTSIVDFLRSQNKPSDFASRKSAYDSSGLTNTFGDYRGTAEQNTTLLRKLSTPAQTSPLESLQPKETFTPKDVIDTTTPSTISSAFDMEKSDAEKLADIEKNQASMDLGAETTRASEGLGRDVETLKRTAGESAADVAQQGAQATEKVRGAYEAAGLFRSGKRETSEAEIAQEVATKQSSIQSKLGDQLYNTFSDFEKNYGTEFLSKLSIPEAQSFSQLPVAVRGIVMKNYQDAIQKAEEKAGKSTIDALDKLGYVVMGGQIIKKPSEIRAEAAETRAEEGLLLRGESASRAEESLKLTMERLQMAIDKNEYKNWTGDELRTLIRLGKSEGKDWQSILDAITLNPKILNKDDAKKIIDTMKTEETNEPSKFQGLTDRVKSIWDKVF